MKRYVYAKKKLEPSFSFNRKYYADTKERNNRFYKADNDDMIDAEEISPDEFFEAAEEYQRRFGQF